MKSDSTVSNKWSMYEYNKASGHIVDLAHSHMMFPEWWEYADWYAKGYNSILQQ